MQGDVAIGFGISRLLYNIEGQVFVRNKFSHAFPDHHSVAKFALPVRADEVPAVSGLGRIRKAEPENPVGRRISNFWEGEHVRPDFRRRRVD